jgi:putative hydrolase of the HAD superfamily
MPTRWVIFDAVGTLLRPRPSVARAYWDAGRRHGSQLDEVEVGRRFRAAFAAFEQSELAGADPNHAAVLRTTEDHESHRWRSIVANLFDDVIDCGACYAELHRHFAEPSAWELFPDVEAAVRGLHERGVHVGVASNFDERLVRVMRDQSVMPFVRFVLPSSTLGYRKPSRYFFDRVRETAGCPVEELLYVGDDWAHDVLAARNAGLPALHVNRAAIESDPGRVTDLRELLERLE